MQVAGSDGQFLRLTINTSSLLEKLRAVANVKKGGGADNSSCRTCFCFIYPPSLIPIGASASHAQLKNHLAPSCQSVTLRSIFLTSSSAKTAVPEIQKKKQLKIRSVSQSISLFLPDNRRAGNTICLKRGNHRTLLKDRKP